MGNAQGGASGGNRGAKDTPDSSGRRIVDAAGNIAIEHLDAEGGRGDSEGNVEQGEEKFQEEEEEEEEGLADGSQLPKSDRLKEWFKCFVHEQESDRQGVTQWARMCIWRYFWDYLFEVKFNQTLSDEKEWGRPLPSIHERHANIKYICEKTLRKMDKKPRDRVIGLLCAFSDLQGPDVYWDPILRGEGTSALESMDTTEADMKTITENFGVLTIDLVAGEKMQPVVGRWMSQSHIPTGNEENADVVDDGSSDLLTILLSKTGWEDLKLLTAINTNARVKKLRAMRQKIRMLHGTKVTVLMKKCVRCQSEQTEGVSNCFIDGILEFNGHPVSTKAHRIIDYNPQFTFRLVNLDSRSFTRCGKSCVGNVDMSQFESGVDSDKFTLHSLLNNNVDPTRAADWEAALRRRRTCGLSFHFYVAVYSNPEMCKQPIEVVKAAIKKTEGSRSIIYQSLFENQIEGLGRSLEELYKRMDSICKQNETAYWFKFWITACKALFPDSNQVPSEFWDFDFLANSKAICYRMLDRPALNELLKKTNLLPSDAKDKRANMFTQSQANSIMRVLDRVYTILAQMKRDREAVERGEKPLKKGGNDDNKSRGKDKDNKDKNNKDKGGDDGEGNGDDGENGNGNESNGKRGGGNSKTSAEFDKIAAESAQVMSQIVSIQQRVAKQVITKEQAKEELAQMALKNPTVFDAFGGTSAIMHLSSSFTSTTSTPNMPIINTNINNNSNNYSMPSFAAAAGPSSTMNMNMNMLTSANVSVGNQLDIDPQTLALQQQLKQQHEQFLLMQEQQTKLMAQQAEKLAAALAAAAAATTAAANATKEARSSSRSRSRNGNNDSDNDDGSDDEEEVSRKKKNKNKNSSRNGKKNDDASEKKDADNDDDDDNASDSKNSNGNKKQKSSKKNKKNDASSDESDDNGNDSDADSSDDSDTSTSSSGKGGKAKKRNPSTRSRMCLSAAETDGKDNDDDGCTIV